jgi:hypothetical protein
MSVSIFLEQFLLGLNVKCLRRFCRGKTPYNRNTSEPLPGTSQFSVPLLLTGDIHPIQAVMPPIPITTRLILQQLNLAATKPARS